jgi:predicted enzyme related to lactoylglutathione lyase
MPEVKEYEPGTPSWVDLGSPDIEASAAFYAGVFGWTFEPAGPVEETGGYGMFTLQGLNVAGLGPQMNADQPPYWTMYVSVADIEGTTARAAAHGGTIVVAPMEVFTAGKMAVYIDSVGAPVSAWQPNEHIGAQLVNEPGAFTWDELRTGDVGAAISFYERVFNWVANPMEMDGNPYTLWNLGERPVGVMMHDAAGPSRWDISFAVADCDAAVAQAQALGATVVAPAVDSSAGRFAGLADPHGASFGVIQLAS